jgi:hypothetical protein
MNRVARRGRVSAWALACLLLVGAPLRAALPSPGRVVVHGMPVPGATITAAQGASRRVTTTNEDGNWRLDLGPGAWTVRVEMRGFAPLERQIEAGAPAPAREWSLALLPSDAPLDDPPFPPAAGAQAAPAAQGASSAADTSAQKASSGLVVAGSANNAAASPFAQAPAFGNNRPGQRSLFDGSLSLVGGNSAWDSRPFSFSNQAVARPDAADLQIGGSFSGPLRLPMSHVRMFVMASVQRAVTTSSEAVAWRVPTALERAGDFSQTTDATGRRETITDPLTGRPFDGGVIPVSRRSPQASSLLAYYPAPNVTDGGAANFAGRSTDHRVRNGGQARASGNLTARQQWTANLAFDRSTMTSTSPFAFVDRARSSSIDASLTWSYRRSSTRTLHARYGFIQNASSMMPYFANRVDVTREAGIADTDPAPASWGPPALMFASGLAGLGTALPAGRRTRTHALSADGVWLRGHHNVTYGAEWRPTRIASPTSGNPRGSFTFTGAATGDDVADFVLGLPSASAIAFGSGSTFLGAGANAFVMDEWSLAPGFTLNVGLRWEHESPLREAAGRLANLDLAADFSRAAAVTPETPVGAATGRRFDRALLRPDWRGIQPRVGASWRPMAASTLLIRAGYGLYQQNGIYAPIASWLARQPPFYRTATRASTPDRPLTLANGLATSPDTLANTLAVDPDLRMGYAETWNASVQRDLPGSLTMMASYLGTRGHDLLQESLPNTAPPGAPAVCAACPAGFIYVSSTGRSIRHSLTLQLRRRLRAGFTSSAQYVLASAYDDATAFGGVGEQASAIVQDWRNPGADWGPSPFDQRHLLTWSAEYTTGVGVAGGALRRGLAGTLWRGWILTAQLGAGSGLPLTPHLLLPVPGTGIAGTIRASTTDASISPAPGSFLDPAAYTSPAPGEWGTAGRNSARGPAQVSFDAGVGRSLPMRNGMTLDWRVDATNVINHVNYTSVDALLGSPRFGLPDRASPMRKLRVSIRWRF